MSLCICGVLQTPCTCRISVLNSEMPLLPTGPWIWYMYIASLPIINVRCLWLVYAVNTLPSRKYQFWPCFCVNENDIYVRNKTRNQNNGFELVLVHSCTIISPTTAEKEIFLRYSVCFPPRNKRSAPNLSKSNCHGVIPTRKWRTSWEYKAKIM